MCFGGSELSKNTRTTLFLPNYPLLTKFKKTEFCLHFPLPAFHTVSFHPNQGTILSKIYSFPKIYLVLGEGLSLKTSSQNHPTLILKDHIPLRKLSSLFWIISDLRKWRKKNGSAVIFSLEKNASIIIDPKLFEKKML